MCFCAKWPDPEDNEQFMQKLFMIDDTEQRYKIVYRMFINRRLCMGSKKARKTDRRSVYTRNVIKDSLLSLLAEKDLADISISELCREAEINRGTFYLHYDNTSEVLDELFDDACFITEAVSLLESDEDLRNDFIKRLSVISSGIHERITNGKEISNIEYQPSVLFYDDIKEQKNIFLSNLLSTRERDKEHGNTQKGPHKDDIDIKIKGKSTRRYGSQGQQRTVALSMKLAEIELINEDKNDYPVLLLDDVFSELDIERQRYLVDYLKKMQVFITSAEISDKMTDFFPDSRRIEVKSGSLI